MYKIFIVEDDETIGSIICKSLNKWGFEANIVSDFRNVLNEYSKIKPHMVLMDINLPFYDGFYWCEQIRKISNIPIVFISSRADDNDKIRAIMGGGDDYIEKPFSIEVLIAKVQATLRRAYDYTDSTYNILSHGDIILDLEKSQVTCKEKSVPLTHNESKILCLLIKSSGKVVSRGKIIKNLWEDENFIDENTLTVNMNRLRNKLKGIIEDELITTIKGKGYKLE